MNRHLRGVCEGCNKEFRSDKLKAHRLKCKKFPYKTPSKIAKCPHCPYTDKNGNLRRHMKKSQKCRPALIAHQQALNDQESARDHLDEAESEAETTNTLMLDKI
jgi:hypothetical protein